MSDLPKDKPILCVDFDGVIHRYTSGWQGPRKIPDGSVEGAIEFLIEATKHFQVCIYSSRSRYLFGKWAIKRWLKKEFVYQAYDKEYSLDSVIFRFIGETAFADPWDYEVKYAARRLIKLLKFPTRKPAAFLQIDDRAICFDGHFPPAELLLLFKPWNKR